MKDETKTARRFLRYFAPKGPWVLTAIPPDGGKTWTAYFEPKTEKAMCEWIDKHNGKNNLYFMVNPPRSEIKSKAKKTDVEEMAWLHVDVDPAKGEKFADEQTRILKTLEDFKPRPSCVIFSGGGYQAFWRLDAPVFVGGDLGAIEELEGYNIQVAQQTGGDNCHNLDRIMRLPGTYNIPGEKKLKKNPERTTILAETVWEEEAVHPLASFVCAPRIQTKDTPGGSAKVELSGNLAPVDLEDLPEGVNLRLKAIIVQGDDPEDPTRYSSKSEAVFGVCCMLIRAGVDDDTIASIILDPDFGISEHTRKQKRSRNYAARQIQRAKEEVEEPWLRLLNEKFAVISDIGGKCRVISEVYDEVLERSRISMQTFEDFRNRYMNQKVEIGSDKDGRPIYEPAGKWWLKHPLRRQYDNIIFAPNREIDNSYNLWQGFNFQPLPGKCEKFLNHLKTIICNGNEEYYNYLIQWLARCVQKPATQGEVAVVLRGKQGTGKGTFINAFGKLWGRHFLQVSNSKHLVGQFNYHLRDCIVLFADEAFFAGDKAHEGVLKALVTESMLMVERKGVDAAPGPNFTHILMASNSDWVVPANQEERRYFVLDVSNEKMQNTAYFSSVKKEMESGGYEALLHYLMTLDISNFNVRDVPKTEALGDQKMLSLSPEQTWWYSRLVEGTQIDKFDEWERNVTTKAVFKDYIAFCDAQRYFHRASPPALGKFLRGSIPGLQSKQIAMTIEEQDPATGMTREKNVRPYVYLFPSLEDCRKIWDKTFGTKTDWNAPPQVETIDDDSESPF